MSREWIPNELPPVLPKRGDKYRLKDLTPEGWTELGVTIETLDIQPRVAHFLPPMQGAAIVRCVTGKAKVRSTLGEDQLVRGGWTQIPYGNPGGVPFEVSTDSVNPVRLLIVQFPGFAPPLTHKTWKRDKIKPRWFYSNSTAVPVLAITEVGEQMRGQVPYATHSWLDVAKLNKYVNKERDSFLLCTGGSGMVRFTNPDEPTYPCMAGTYGFVPAGTPLSCEATFGKRNPLKFDLIQVAHMC
jgi:hypothetical protein